jgi:hypothetical protein
VVVVVLVVVVLLLLVVVVQTSQEHYVFVSSQMFSVQCLIHDNDDQQKVNCPTFEGLDLLDHNESVANSNCIESQQ